MKTRLLILLCLGIFSVNAQTTHNLDWFTNIGTNVDLTITSGDTVIWTWTNPNHTVENDVSNSVETFNSGFLGATGSTYEYTFTVVGVNDYFCGVHGAASMSGTITVEENLGIGDETLKRFNIITNPVNQNINISLPQNLLDGKITIYDLLGKKIITNSFKNSTNISLDVSALNSGLYILTIESNGVSQTQRFIKN
jgi:hypothetical protein